MRINPEQGTQFAQMMVADDEPMADINQVCLASVFISCFLFMLVVCLLCKVCMYLLTLLLTCR